jgi:hypothetical protein
MVKMSQSDHKEMFTRGPWESVDEGYAVVIYGNPDVDSRDRPLMERVCEVADTQREEANARLIASAPDLLEILEAIYKTWPLHGIAPELDQRIVATLKRARGA